MKVQDGNFGWPAPWEKMSADRAKPRHVPRWPAADTGRVLCEEDHQRLAGDWVDGIDSASRG